MTRSITEILEEIEGRADNGPFLITILDQVEGEKKRLLSALRKAIEQRNDALRYEVMLGEKNPRYHGDIFVARVKGGNAELAAILEGGK